MFKINNLIRAIAATAAAACLTLSIGGSAWASTTPMISNQATSEISAPDESEFTGVVTMDSVEFSALNDSERAKLVGMKIILSDSDTEYATVEKAETDQTAVPGIESRLNKVTCDGRLDWYRLVNTSMGNTCFANAGKKTVGVSKVKGHCPGANQGRFHYFRDEGRTDGVSDWRGPEVKSKWTNCYWLNNNANVYVVKVEIK